MAVVGDSRRTARVQITYDLDVAGELRRKELPFVLGVLGDFAGKSEPALPKLRDREFIEVSRDNFNAVLKNMRPRLTLAVPNRLVGDGSKLAVTLRFQSLEDFEPEQVAQQVEPLRRLIALRQQLSALRATVRTSGSLATRPAKPADHPAALDPHAHAAGRSPGNGAPRV
jgi:type VI secretion system protein ImpB